jgi:hypothetical protein
LFGRLVAVGFFGGSVAMAIAFERPSRFIVIADFRREAV